ncbi:unnamed protein product [Cyprideis torosa]|uniref:Uncharacterized protein n=1 Tax=Cyprideis torosa TaxID=163714 RepID=A0A7R8WDF1_9CRUS|nr:unnamed protein product [Cyprideis torosa]CAG0891677.1 unnamed protein product [Cyprideis torosa]
MRVFNEGNPNGSYYALTTTLSTTSVLTPVTSIRSYLPPGSERPFTPSFSKALKTVVGSLETLRMLNEVAGKPGTPPEEFVGVFQSLTSVTSIPFKTFCQLGTAVWDLNSKVPGSAVFCTPQTYEDRSGYPEMEGGGKRSGI